MSRTRKSGTKAKREQAAIEALLRHFSGSGRGDWVIELRPDEENRSEPLPDFVIREKRTNQLAAVEVTSFDWPLDIGTVQSGMNFAGREVAARLQGQVEGTFGITVDLLVVRDAEAFARNRRGATIQQLADLVLEHGASMRVGESKGINEPFPLRLTRLSDSGDPYVGWVSIASVDSFQRLDEMEEVLRQNSKKFAGFPRMPHLLLVVVAMTEEALRLIGPALNIPDGVDELYFLIREDSTPRIVGYAAISTPEPGVMLDRNQRALKVEVLFKETE